MKSILLIIFCLSTILSFGQLDKTALLQASQSYQNELNLGFADEASTPLNKEDLEHFETLPFFPISADYIVEARLEKFKKKEIEIFQTSTSRMPSYTIYGKLYFQLNGDNFELTLYQNPSFKKDKAHKNYLFLPFTDLTNGEATYGGGRYLDFYIQQSSTVMLDFNQAYNPYCAYSDKYSCPVPPKNNFLNTEVKAGVMLLEGHE
jgi:uncharacterized protein (DUF1684 family)